MSKGAPFFSIITVCRNAEATISAALESLAAQTFKGWEWIMIDGASTDQTVARSSILDSKGMGMKVLSEPDQGIFDAMNKGVRLAMGRYVYFLNSDDELADEKVLADVFDEIERAGLPDFIYGNIRLRDRDGDAGMFAPPRPEHAAEFMVTGCLPHQGSFAKREHFHGGVGFFDPSYRSAGDYAWMLRMVSLPGVKLHYVDRVVAIYHVAGRSCDLSIALPESFRAVNETPEFREHIGEARLVGIYQHEIANLRVSEKDLSARERFLAAKVAKLEGKIGRLIEKVLKLENKLAASRSTKRSKPPGSSWWRRLVPQRRRRRQGDNSPE